MGTSRVNHVSVSATDLAASTEFYGRLLGAEPIATPDFGFPVQWLALEDTQLHIFERDSPPTQHHHFGVEVDLDRLVSAYRLCAELDAFDDDTFRHRLVGLPGDCIQLYLRDPAGNLVELNAVGASRLPDDLREDLQILADVRPQDGEHGDARLYIGADRPAPDAVSA
jgi:catechol 2,3-dioxygenase-like lactoylglutathione lyase family enzyme